MDLFDAYVVRARLFPAVIAVVPALTLLLLAGNWTAPNIPEIISSVGIGVLLFAGADLARRAGLRKERQLFSATGGRPYISELSRADNSLFDEVSKAEYRSFLAAKINRQVPSAAEETADADGAREFYNACSRWLRENTRDKERFHVLQGENISYGFRRNMWGLKWFGVAVNIGTVVAAYAIYRYQPQFMSVSDGKLIAQSGIAAIHVIYLLIGVSKRAVLEASRTYARQLVLSVETLKSA